MTYYYEVTTANPYDPCILFFTEEITTHDEDMYIAGQIIARKYGKSVEKRGYRVRPISQKEAEHYKGFFAQLYNVCNDFYTYDKVNGLQRY